MRELALSRMLACVPGLLALAATVAAAEEPGGHAYNPPVAVATPDAARAVASFRKPAGWSVGLFAAEPLLANPVAFGFDEKGRVYAVETFRLKHGVTDNRAHMSWLDDDLASRTVADRVAMYRKHLGKEAESYGVEHDRVRLIEDRDGDGKADHATVFADGFNGLESGLAAGVLARKGDVYFTCIPDLWRLRDTDGDGKADARDALHTGYGVHVAFLGHDLHGLKFGPDGRLYFSIGDRGLHVTTADGRTVSCPDTGAVLRCEPDGSGLELYATGLRNPQELAFDEFGNLFTVDNNSDSGDKARLVHVVEGGDSGWRVGYQYLEKPVSRGPWNAEKLWHPRPDNTAAYLLPPLANIADGPSGLVYNPGSTRLPDRFRRHFFLADFRGGPATSGVRAFSVKADGASFALDDSEQLFWGVLATDVDFGPDGALYVSDWVNGWDTTGKGRIYTLFDPSTPPGAANEVKAFLAAGFTRLSARELKARLAHPDMRIRQEAQFELVDRASAPGRDPAAAAALKDVASGDTSSFARLHAVWGLGRLARQTTEHRDTLIDLCRDPDAEVRAQAVKALGDLDDFRSDRLTGVVRGLLRDGNPRVRFFAAMTLGKSGGRGAEAVPALLELLRENGDRDLYLRHAAVMSLARLDPATLVANSGDPSPAVRLGVLLALRRRRDPEVARFLTDDDPRLTLEAARAVYDIPIAAALPRLAALPERPGLTDPVLRRVIQANARLGGPDAARRLARTASRRDLPEAARVEAVEALAGWPGPPGRDRVTGLWRPYPPSPAVEAADAFGPVISELLRDPSAAVAEASLRAAGPLPMRAAGPAFLAVVSDPSRPAESRAEALRALARLDDPRLLDAVKQAVDDASPAVRVEGQRLLASLRPDAALPVLTLALDKGSLRERQGSFAALGGMPAGGADELLCTWLDRLKAGRLPSDVEFDLLEAASRRVSAEVTRRLHDLDASRLPGDPVDAVRETLNGGDASRGEKIFTDRAEVSCLRCHKVGGRGGEVGPDLTGVGSRQDRRYLLESIVAPNRQIAKGFETLLISTVDGRLLSGILKEDSGPDLRLVTAEGTLLTIPKADVEEQKRGASAMPDDLSKHLSKSELRDLVEYLASLK